MKIWLAVLTIVFIWTTWGGQVSDAYGHMSVPSRMETHSDEWCEVEPILWFDWTDLRIVSNGGIVKECHPYNQ